MMTIEQLRARRVELAAQMDRERLVFADLEETIRQQRRELKEQQRKIDVMYGAIQQLDALLAQLEQEQESHA